MNQFLVVLFANVSIFVFYAFCMNTSDLDLPPPPPPSRDVKFGDCFTVHKIRGPSLATDIYNYNHICPVKFPDNEPEPPEDQKAWYIVGWLDKFNMTTPPADYLKIKQSLMKFTYLRKATVEFNIGSSIALAYKIEFQSFQHSQAFYAIIYHNVLLDSLAPNKIGVLHEMINRELRKIDNNVEALGEIINGIWHITFKNERDEPLLIFSQQRTAIMRIKDPPNNKPQLLLRIHTWYHILTFANSIEVSEFRIALLKYLKTLHINNNFANTVACFGNNQITIDS